MPKMIKMYCRLWIELGGVVERVYSLSREGIRHHIYDLLDKLGYEMRQPKVIDAKRCITFASLDAWYKDPEVRTALKGKYRCLIFNADETECNRKAASPGPVASKKGVQPCVALSDRSGSHVSLFMIISAAGDLVPPTVVLHGNPDVFLPNTLAAPQVKCVRTKKGYMERETFKMLMRDHFIPYVTEVRKRMVGIPEKQKAGCSCTGWTWLKVRRGDVGFTPEG